MDPVGTPEGRVKRMVGIYGPGSATEDVGVDIDDVVDVPMVWKPG
jgi:hypothetical protein